MLVQVVQHDPCDGVSLQHDHEPLPGAPRGLVTNIGDALHLALFDELGDLHGEVVGIHLVGQFGYHQAGAPVDLLHVDDGPHGDRAAPRSVRLFNAFPAQDARPRGEVGASNPLHESIQQLITVRVGMLEHPDRARGDLTQVVRGNIRRHPHRDSHGPIDEQVRDAAGQHDRLLGLAVVVVLEVDRVLFDIPDHFEGQLCHAGLGVPWRGGWVVSGGPEVSLPSCQGVAHTPRLDQTHQRVVDGGVTMGVELPHHLTDDTGTLREALVWAVPAVVHPVDDASVHGLESVSHIRKSSAHDDAHRIVKVRPLHLQVEIHGLNISVVVGGLFVSHLLLYSLFACGRRIGGGIRLDV